MTSRPLTLEECRVEFRRRFSGIDVRATMAKFCQVTEDTVYRWNGGKQLPVGEQAVRLLCWYRLCGLKPEALEGHSLAAKLAELIAFDIVSVDQAVEGLKYSSTHGIFRFILHGSGMMPDREYRLRKLIETHDIDRRAAKERWQAEFAAIQSGKPSLRATLVEPAAEAGRLEERIASRPALTESNELVEPLAHQLVATASLIQLSDEAGSTDADMAKLRLMVGSDRIACMLGFLRHLSE